MKGNKVDAEAYNADPDRFILVDGHSDDAPSCPFGNVQELVGYDTHDKRYVRFTKSVYKRLRDQTTAPPAIVTPRKKDNN